MSQHFSYSSEFDASRESLFDYHARPGAIDRLIPPWESIELLLRAESLKPGSQVVLEQSLFGIRQHWMAEHTELSPPNLFRDEQKAGPFKSWNHTHRFEHLSEGRARLTDDIEFTLKFEPWSRLAKGWVHQKLHLGFRYRHETTRDDLLLERFLEKWTDRKTLRIAVTGSNGLLGKRICALASVLGHEVIRITRPESSIKNESARLGTSVQWDGKNGFDRPEILSGADAVIHLAGFSLAEKRWTKDVQEKILRSRRDGTRSLVNALQSLSVPPKAFVCASGVGIYGERGDQICDEAVPPANDFLGNVARQWEESANEYSSSGGRVAIGRLAMVLHPREGALAKMLPLFRMCLGGRVGDGNQYWSWIHADDAAAAFLFLATCQDAVGPYNLCAPESTTNRQFTGELARAVNRPAIFPAPAIAIRTVLGEMADSLLLTSTRAIPTQLTEVGFPFRASNLQDAFRRLLGIC